MCDVALRWTSLLAAQKSSAAGVALVARVIVATVFVVVAAGFYYWGLPYAYGVKLTTEEHAARKWISTW